MYIVTDAYISIKKRSSFNCVNLLLTNNIYVNLNAAFYFLCGVILLLFLAFDINVVIKILSSLLTSDRST